MTKKSDQNVGKLSNNYQVVTIQSSFSIGNVVLYSLLKRSYKLCKNVSNINDTVSNFKNLGH